MLYEWHITVTADTEEASPIEEKVSIHTGVITRIEVFMPPGCHGMVYASVSYRQTALMPFNSKGGVATDGIPVTGSYHHEINDPQPKLTVRGWSPNTGFDHVVTIRVTILPKIVASMIPLMNTILGFLEKMMGRRIS